MCVSFQQMFSKFFISLFSGYRLFILMFLSNLASILSKWSKPHIYIYTHLLWFDQITFQWQWRRVHLANCHFPKILITLSVQNVFSHMFVTYTVDKHEPLLRVLENPVSFKYYLFPFISYALHCHSIHGMWLQ